MPRGGQTSVPSTVRLEFLDMAVRPGDAERRDEMRAALVGRGRAALAELVFDALHGVCEILVRTGPARRIDAGLAVERVDREAGIVREGRQTGRRGGGAAP